MELHFVGRNHSDNSIVLLLPKEKILFAVDFIPVETVAFRNFPDAYPEEWIESLKQVEKLDFKVLVPAHGRIGKKDHVRQFREYLEDLRTAVRQFILRGASLEETQETIKLPKYERWNFFQEWFPQNVEAIYRDITLHRVGNP